MRTYRFELLLALGLLAVLGVVWLWQNPGIVRGPMRREEIDQYLSILEQRPYPAEEKPALMQSLRAWMEADDGQPVYMLNLMRFRHELRHFDGDLDFDGTPREANVRYERAVMPLLLERGGYAAYAGTIEDANLMSSEAELDHWSRILLVRYPSRRSFMDMLVDPAFQRVVPYKLMALKVVLTPTRRELLLPDAVQSTAAALLVIYLAVCWRRAARQSLATR